MLHNGSTEVQSFVPTRGVGEALELGNDGVLEFGVNEFDFLLN
jgi:hypothetical protein